MTGVLLADTFITKPRTAGEKLACFNNGYQRKNIGSAESMADCDCRVRYRVDAGLDKCSGLSAAARVAPDLSSLCCSVAKSLRIRSYFLMIDEIAGMPQQPGHDNG